MNFLSEITGSFSQPCAENPTVAMVEAAYEHHGMDWRYLNCEVSSQNLADAVAGARAMNWAGFNCSLPHKIAVIPLLDGLGESAAIIGAVNCVVRRGERYLGENTDGKGFVKSLLEKSELQGKSLVLLGAGGAARAISVESALAGARAIHVVNRSMERGLALVKLINEQTPATATFSLWSGNFVVPPETDIVINATSIGMAPNLSACPAIALDSLQPHMVVADVIPNPPETELLRAAASRGCSVVDGLGMLVHQGVEGIRYWSGIEVDPAVMRARLEEIFGTSLCRK